MPNVAREHLHVAIEALESNTNPELDPADIDDAVHAMREALAESDDV